MGTEVPNNTNKDTNNNIQINSNYYHCGGATVAGDPDGTNAYNHPYVQYQQQQQHREDAPAHSLNHVSVNVMNSRMTVEERQGTNNYNNNQNNSTWPSMCSSSSSDKSSPSSSSGNYSSCQVRHQPNSNYYLQNFGQPRGHWEFMSSMQKQIESSSSQAYNLCDLTHGRAGPVCSSGTSTSSSSMSSTSSSSQQNNQCGQGQDPFQLGGSVSYSRVSSSDQKKLAGPYNYYQAQSGQHYANTLHYHQQQMLNLASGLCDK